MIIYSWLINNSSPHAYHFPVLQSVTITTNVVSSNPTHGKVYITLYDTVCQWLVAGLWFSPVFSTNKTDWHDITEILLKMVLNTIIHWFFLVDVDRPSLQPFVRNIWVYAIWSWVGKGWDCESYDTLNMSTSIC